MHLYCLVFFITYRNIEACMYGLPYVMQVAKYELSVWLLSLRRRHQQMYMATSSLTYFTFCIILPYPYYCEVLKCIYASVPCHSFCLFLELREISIGDCMSNLGVGTELILDYISTNKIRTAAKKTAKTSIDAAIYNRATSESTITSTYCNV